MVSDLLFRGKRNAVSTAYLCRRLSISARELRRRVHRERLEGIVILSSCTGGYFLPESAEETKEFVRITNKKAISTLRGLRSARELLGELEQIEGQAAIKDGGN